LSPKAVQQVLEIHTEGRKLGVRAGQVNQSPAAKNQIGGTEARDMMGGGGSMIGHRTGGGVSSGMATSSTSEPIDLRKLPSGGGWAAIIRKGDVQAKVCRVRYATKEAVLAVLDGITVRALDGADLAAAGKTYRQRITGPEAAAAMLKAQAAEKAGEDAALVVVVDEHQDDVDDEIPGQTALDVDDDQGDVDDHTPTLTATDETVDEGLNRGLTGSQRSARKARELGLENLLTALRAAPDGLTRAQMQDATGMTRPTVGRCITELHDAGRITQNADDRTWHLAMAEQTA
jgi:hypothetical protein